MSIYKGVMKYLLCTLLIYLPRASGFNLGGSSRNVKYLTARIDQSPDNPGFNNRSTFYGYDLEFTDRNELLITSPHWKNPLNSQSNDSNTSEGTMEKCTVTFATKDGCQKTRLPTRKPGDSFGMTVESSGNVLKACSPAKVLRCNASHRVPGYCYESLDNGENWLALKKKRPKCLQPKQKLDIIFVLDGSYSVLDNFDDIIRWTQNMAARFGVNSGVNQVGVVLYSTYQRGRGKTLRNQKYITTEIKLGQFKRSWGLNNTIGKIKRKGVSTYTAHALNKTVLDFRDGPRWSDPDTKKVMVVLTDGDASDGDQLEGSANYVRSLGIIPFAVGVGDYDITELRTIATGDPTSDQRVLSVADFDRLDGIVQELSTAIEQVVLEGGTKSVFISSYNYEMAQTGFSMDSSDKKSMLFRLKSGRMDSGWIYYHRDVAFYHCFSQLAVATFTEFHILSTSRNRRLYGLIASSLYYPNSNTIEGLETKRFF